MSNGDIPKEYRKQACSFCGQTPPQSGRLISGPKRVFICEQCVSLCQEIIGEDPRSLTEKSLATTIENLSPKEISRQLDEYVIGQDYAKRVLSVSVYNHYKRIWSMSVPDGVEIQKNNILMVGPTGSGKTLLAQTLARILDVPFAIADATSLTEAGYVGDDVENILLRLIQAADYDIARAERGIIYIDEIDKIARKGANPSITRDVSGEGVQQALLKVVEGSIATVPPQGGRKHPQQELIRINTDNILFICGGTFEGLDEIISKRTVLGQQNMGFRAAKRINSSFDDIMIQVNSDDLLKYGFIPELVGRLPVITTLEKLDKATLFRILTEPKNALVKQYTYLFSLDGVELTITDKALESAAQLALNRKTGARGLPSIFEQAFLDVMFHAPSLKEIKHCILDAKNIGQLDNPKLLDVNLKVVELPQDKVIPA